MVLECKESREFGREHVREVVAGAGCRMQGTFCFFKLKFLKMCQYSNRQSAIREILLILVYIQFNELNDLIFSLMMGLPTCLTISQAAFEGDPNLVMMMEEAFGDGAEFLDLLGLILTNQYFNPRTLAAADDMVHAES
ncbi:hypothetical protein VP01_1998g2 [Puccinia sorghi]|uniref:Uncharacterized protein n=1 Tax=Puccinia sorghi TaxID=27349 RepID=A0A0L6VC29_9BASI|nr:hypothetical protein VP01_1998g2 [Puccinia sorghi]